MTRGTPLLLVLLAACGPAVRGPRLDPALAPEVHAAAEWPDSRAAADMAARGLAMPVARRDDRLELLAACVVPATYTERTLDGTSAGVPVTERTLASLPGNTLPDDPACTTATHVVTRVGGDTVELLPVQRPTLVPDATHITVDGRSGEAWSLRADDSHPICTLPCSIWMRPASEHALVRDGDHERVRIFGPTAREPDLHLAVGTVKDPLWPWLGIALSAFGAGLTATTIALGPSPSGTSSGSGSSGSGSWNPAGFLVVGVLALAIDGWSAFYLLRGPSQLPALVPARP